ncbi:ferritin-3, chloroplastic-like isoform X2 [Juglans microcarpa x Juglans regia]|uniref:ferritin-3, chloroplastic-like isoform X2 n=1 Tax=Juglans microcarpa x Juglans regia TaxID=2249226 RepID=UPI001B7DE5FF|nr:ferritin-3, chloroplastic-like isoform X2 [Juglans microcarpa x Juglans regia]
MFLRPFSVSASSLSSMRGDAHGHRGSFLFTTRTAPSSASSLNYPFSSSTASVIFSQRSGSNKFVVSSSSEIVDAPLTGVLFQPFEELKKDAHVVPVSPHVSIARQGYSKECEAAINEQINVEYNVSYVYHAMFAFFDRDNITLKGPAKFFKESSEEEREHAEKLIKYQNIRGGKVLLHCIVTPPSEFEDEEKGDALYAMELALALEKLTNEKLLSLHNVADCNNDPQMTEFIESEFLKEQVEAIKKISEYVAQLRMVGKGHGVWHFDQMLLHKGEEAF